jgi:hypothetical protein
MTMLTEVTINGVDVSDYLKKWEVTDELFAGLTEATLELSQDVVTVVTPDIGQTITIKRGFTTSTDEFVFDGYIDELEKTSGVLFKIAGKDKLLDLVRQSVTTSYDKDIDPEAGVISEIFKDLVNTYGGGTLVADNTSIQSSAALPVLTKFVCRGEDVYERCQFLADLIGWQFYYKATTGLVYFEPKGYLGNYGTLTVGDEIMESINWVYDATELANNIVVRGAKQEVETTETGQIGVTSGYTQSTINLSLTPVSTKVYCDAANPPTTLRVGGLTDSTTTFDYSVDAQNKKIVWNTTQYTPGAADFVEVRYSYNVPAPVTGKNYVSIALYGEYKKEFRYDDLKSIADAENKYQSLNEKYSTPFISAEEIPLATLIDLKSGQTITIVDVDNNINTTVLIQNLLKSYPYKGDKINIGDKTWKLSEWQVDVIDKLKEIENQLKGDEDLISQLIATDRTIKPRRRYIKLKKEVLDLDNSFVLGHPLAGILGTSKLGGTITATTYPKVIQGNMTYNEFAYDTDFHDAVNSTATFSTVTNDISFTAGQIWYSDVIDIGTTLSFVTVTLGTTVGTLLIEISSDNKATWQTVTNATRTAVTSSDGTGTYIRITENAAGVATIDNTYDTYGQYTAPCVKVYMEEKNG